MRNKIYAGFIMAMLFALLLFAPIKRVLVNTGHMAYETETAEPEPILAAEPAEAVSETTATAPQTSDPVVLSLLFAIASAGAALVLNRKEV